jgi:hypothetical protein
MKDFKKFSLLEETETRTSDGTAPILNDLQQIGEFHRVVKNYTKMKKIEAMTNTTQIPASEVERIEREAKEFNIGPRSIMIDSWNEGFDEGYIAGAKSEYLRAAERIAELEKRLTEFLSGARPKYNRDQIRQHLEHWVSIELDGKTMDELIDFTENTISLTKFFFDEER